MNVAVAPSLAACDPPFDLRAEARGATFSSALLDAEEPTAWRRELVRFGRGLALSAAFGVALGTRQGGGELLVHGFGVPLALTVAAGLATPSLLILLLHAGLRVDTLAVAATAARAVATAGLLLGGLAPLTALMMVSCEDALSAAVFAWFALLLAGALGLRRLRAEMQPLLAHEPAGTRLAAWAAAAGFAALLALLALRVWTLTLPVLSASEVAAAEATP